MTGVRAFVRAHLAFVLVHAQAVVLLHVPRWTVALEVLVVLRHTSTRETRGIDTRIWFLDVQILLRSDARLQVQREIHAIRTAALEGGAIVDALMGTGDLVRHLQVFTTVLLAVPLVVAQVIVFRTGAFVGTGTVGARVGTDFSSSDFGLAILQLLLILVLLALVNVHARLFVLSQFISIWTVALEATLQVHAVVAAVFHLLAFIDVWAEAVAEEETRKMNRGYLKEPRYIVQYPTQNAQLICW